MALNFNPDTRLAGQIMVLEGATIVPWGEGKAKGVARPAGVFDAQKRLCETAVPYRSIDRPVFLPTQCPNPAEAQPTLSGNVLYGGVAYGHFGHALCESISRLWALDHCGIAIDRIAFIPKRRLTWPNRAVTVLRPIADALGVGEKMVGLGETTRAERLIVPPQGFGVGSMIAGAPEFREFIDARLRQRIPSGGSDRIYISRSKLFSKRGHYLFEEMIEEKLAQEGYEIFHPQEHDLETQLARYKSARMIISSDNSALHLAAFVVDPSCKVAVILRRPGNIFEDFVTQFHHFAGVRPTTIDALQRFWFRAEGPRQFSEVISLVSPELIATRLSQDGFIAKTDWQEPDQNELDQVLNDMAEKAGTEMIEVFP